MALIMITMWYPLTKRAEVTKKYAEVMKKNPKASFEKPLVNALKHEKEGMVAIGIAEVEKGKLEEELNLAHTRMLEFDSIEGFNYKIEALMTFQEDFALRGVVPLK